MPFKKGQVANPNGRPKRPEIEQLRQAIATVEKRKKKKLLVHFVEQAYEDNRTLDALVKKFMPDMKHVEIEGGQNPLTLIVQAIEEHARKRSS
jgi:hypothetical protein